MSGGGSELSTADVLSLGLSRTWYALSRALRLDRLRALLGGAQISLEQGAPVWLLGARYCVRPGAGEAEQEEVRRGQGQGQGLARAAAVDAQAPRRATCLQPTFRTAHPTLQALARLLHRFQSIAWMTYRTSFTPIAVGDVQLRSDAGWGCTLRRCAAAALLRVLEETAAWTLLLRCKACCAAAPRRLTRLPTPLLACCSGQMVLAEGLQRHLLGRHWRWPQPGGDAAGAAAPPEAPPELKRLLQLFWDTPAGEQAHAGCAGGMLLVSVPANDAAC